MAAKPIDWDALLAGSVDFTQRLIQPNITLNRSETEERRKLAADGVKPVNSDSSV